MRKHLAGVAVLALTACATTTSSVAPLAPLMPGAELTPEALLAYNAICGAEKPIASRAKPNLKLAGGMGTGGFKVDTANKAAQDWFDYGLALSHAFYHIDAVTAMRKAVEADPACSACAWGLAWALGPTLNYGIDDKVRTEALAAATNAKSLAKPGDAKAIRLADAMIARYADLSGAATDKTAPTPPRAGRGPTDLAFGQAMQAIAADYPADQELSVLAAHALLIPVRGNDRRGLKPALAILETVLKDHPDDTGAIHYYIHGTEFDGRAEDALPYAKRLGKLAPAASHLVHMPAHTFFRAGLYQEAAVVNAKAIEADSQWLKAGGDPAPPRAPQAEIPMYYGHNTSFGLAGAMMSGDAQLALKYADHAEKVWAGRREQGGTYIVARSYVALARFAPDRALAIAEDRSQTDYIAYRAYARGEALLITGDVAGARAELKMLGALADPSAEQIIAKGVLGGRIAMAEGNPKKAARLFEEAARVQETRLTQSWDPPGWWYPVRRSAAAAYLKGGDFARAEAEAGKSLSSWKHDALALWVQGKAQAALGRTAESEATLAEARKLWRGDFGSLTADAI